MLAARRKYLKWTAVALAVAMACAVLFVFNPETAGIYPRCPSKLITGYDCPGCGSLRGLHALMHGDVAVAWRFNPAIFFAFAMIAMIGFAGIHRHETLAKISRSHITRSSYRMARITDHPAFPIVIFVMIIVWTIMRNI